MTAIQLFLELLSAECALISVHQRGVEVAVWANKKAASFLAAF
jgi:hypothetical protein